MTTPWRTTDPRVSWTTPPLFKIELSKAQLKERFDQAQFVYLTPDGFRLYDVWLLSFPCGLEVALLSFHERSLAPVADDVPVPVEVHANDPERGHLLFHLGFRDLPLAAAPPPSPLGPMSWQVVRRDGDSLVTLGAFTSRCEAEAMAQKAPPSQVALRNPDANPSRDKV